MTTKSRESINGASVRAAAEQAAYARKDADRLACEAWNKRMLGFQGTGSAVSGVRRRSQCGIPLPRSKVSRVHYPPDRCAHHCKATKDDADPMNSKDTCLQGLLAPAETAFQAQPSGCVATCEDFSQRPTINMVAG